MAKDSARKHGTVGGILESAERLALGTLQGIGRTGGWTRALSGALIAAACSPALAGPEGASVARGNVQITRDGANTLIRASRNSIINYRSFNIGSNESVRFIQPDASSRVLNRITTAAPTRIDGSLTANGRVYIVNPAGVIFGNGAMINTAGLYAAGGHLSDKDFVRGVDRFTGLTGAVENRGQINSGLVALVGSHVANLGTIVAPQGTVIMGSGQEALVGERSGNIFVRVKGPASAGAGGAATDNSGTINARGGQVIMGAGDIYAMAVRTTGSVTARDVKLQAQGRGSVQVSGGINASNQGRGKTGGNVDVLGKQISVINARIDASGDNGGGTVHIGGDLQGKGERPHADTVQVDRASSIDVSAKNKGDGGTAIVWSDQFTSFYGTATARGGASGGDGGLVETSSHETVSLSPALIDAGASAGKGGVWLIDPRNVNITANDQFVSASGGNPNTISPTTGGSAGTPSTVDHATIEASLNTGSSVIVTTAQTGRSDAGDITVVNSITKTGGADATLTLIAQNNITINSGATISSSSNKLNVSLQANQTDAGDAGSNTSAGDVIINGTINTNGGTFSSSGVNFTAASTATINTSAAATGTITLNHTGTAAIGGTWSSGGAVSVTATGGITLNSGVTANNANVTFVSNTTAGANNLTVSSGSGTIAFQGSLALGANNFTLTGDGLSLTGGANSVTGTGTLTVQPGNDATTIGAGGGLGTLDLNATNLAAVSNGFAQIIVGRSTGTAAINLNALTFNDPVVIRTLSGTINVNGQLTGAGDASITLTGANVLNANIVTAGQAIQINGASTLGANILLDTTNGGGSAAGANIGMNGAINATTADTEGLTLRAGTAGDITLNGAIGNNTALGAFQITSTHNASIGGGPLNATTITQLAGTGTSSFTGLLNASAAGGISMTGAGFSFTGGAATAAGGSFALANSGAVTISTAGLALDGGFSQTGAGTLTLSTSIVTTGDAVSFAAPVTLGAGASVDTTNAGGSAAGANIVFTSAINATTAGVEGLTLNAGTAGDISLAAVGATTATGLLTLSGHNINLNSTVTTGGGVGVAVTNTGVLTIGGTMTLDGNMTQTGTGGTVQANASISTTGDTIGLGGAVTVGAGGLTFNSVGGTVNFGSALALGSNAFTISANDINFFGGAGSVTGTSTITLQPGVDGTSIGIAGGSGTLQLTGTDLLALANGFSQIIIGRATGSQAININAATFADPVLFRSPGGGTISVLGALAGATGSNASFTLTGTSPIDVNANIVTDGQAIQINGPVVLSANALLDTTNGGLTAAGANIGITGTVNALAAGAQGVTFRAGTGGDISLGGAVGGGAFLLSFAITSAHNVNAGAVTSDSISQAAGTGTTAFTGLLTAAGGGINLTGAAFNVSGGVSTVVNGTMTVNNSGALTISGAPISLDGAFAQTGAGATNLNQGITTTGDSITFAGNVTAGAGVTSLDAGAATVSFGGTLALGANPFTISANTIAFNGGPNSVTGTNAITLQPGVDGTSIGVAGASGTLQLSTATLAALTNGFSQIIIGRATGSQAININAVTFSDPVLFRSPGGGTISVLGTLAGAAGSNASVTLTGTAPIDVNADIVTDGQAIQINGPVVLSATALLDATNAGGTAAGANIGITGAVNAQTAGVQGLSLRAGTGGDIALGGPVGASAFLLSFNILSAHNVNAGAITADGITQSAGTGTSTFGGLLTGAGGGINLTGSAFTLTGGATTTGGGTMSVDNTGVLSITGGALGLDGAFAQTNTGAVTLGAALTTTNDAISFAGPVTVSGSVGSLDAGTSTITIGSTLALGANSFLLSANNITFGGGANSVTGTGAITLQPGDPTVTIGLGGAAGAFTPDLTALADGFSQIIIGRTDSTADVHINTATYADPITIRSPLGTIFIDQTVHGTDNASLTFTAASVVMAGNLVTDGNAIQINGPLTLVGALGGNIDSTNVGGFAGANIGVTGAINGTSAGAESLVFQAGTGDIALGGNVGSTTRLNIFNIVNAHNVNGLGVAATAMNQLAGTGTTTFTGLLDASTNGIGLTGNAFTLTGGLTTGNNVGVTITNGGLLIITGLVSLDGGLTQIGAGGVDLASTITTTGDAVSFAAPVTLLGGTSIATSGGDISFGNTLDGTFAFNLAAGAGNVTFSNNVGSSAALGATNVFTSGSVTVGGSWAGAAANLISTGAVTLNNVVTTPGGFSSTGSTFHNLASITTTNTNITVNHTAGVIIGGDLTAGSGAIALSSGSGGAGDLTFGAGVDLSGASISLGAGSGSGTAIVDALTNTPLFHGAAGGATSPTAFVFRQDGAISGVNLPVAAQFGGGLTGVAYTISSTNGTVIIDDANQVNGTALTLSGVGVGPTAVLLNVPVSVQSLHSLSGATLTNDVTATTGNIQFDGPSLAVGALTLSAGNGTVGFGSTLAADGSALAISAVDVNLGGVVTPGGGGTLQIQTADPSKDIFLGGTGSEGSGDMHLQNAELANIGAGFSSVTIGRNDMTGTIRGVSAVQLASPLTLLAPGTVLSDNLTTFGDAVIITGNLTIAGNVGIDTTGGGGFPGGANVSIGGTSNADNVSNVRNFTINGGTGGAVALGGDVGDTQRLAIFSAAGSSVVLHNVSTLGAQTYAGAVTLSSTLDISAAGAINILGALTLLSDATMHTPGGATDNISLGTVNSDATPRSLTLDAGAAGQVTTGALGGTSALANLTVTGATISVVSANTTGFQGYNGALTIFGDLTGTSIAANSDLLLEESATIAGSTSASFNGTVRSQTGEHNSLTVNAPTTIFNGSIGDAAGSELGALTTDAGGLLNIHSAVINTTGAQSFGDATTVFSDLVITCGGGVTFGSTLNSDTTPRTLAVNTGGNSDTVFAGAVGGIAIFQSITTNADGTTRIGGNVLTAGAQTYNDALVLTSNTLLDGVGLTFGSTINSDGTARSLTLNAHTGNAVISGVVGAVSPLASLAITGTNISLVGATTTGAQSYTGDTTLGGALASTGAGSVDVTGALFLSADSSMTTAGGASDHISVTGAVNSPALPHALTVNAGAGNVSMISNIGLGTALSSLSLTGANIVAHAVTTTGAQTYTGALTIDNNLTSTGAGAVTISGALKLDADVVVSTASGDALFLGTVDSGLLAHGLTVNTGGNGTTRFGGAVGSLSQLTSVTTNADGTTHIDGGSVKTSADQTYNDAMVLGADTTLNGRTFIFKKIDSDAAGTPRALVVNSSSTGDTRFQGNVGFTARLASITTNADGQTKIGAILQTTNGMTFADTITITANSTLDGGNGSLFFQKAIDADTTATDPLLTLLSNAAADADNTPFKFSANIGATRRLGGLTLGADRAPPLAATAIITDSFNASGRILAAGISSTDSFTITTGNGGFTMGRGQKLTTMGAINILTTGTAALGDLTALTTIKVTANRIVIKLRNAAPVLDDVFETPADQQQTDTGVDFVAAGSIDFSTVPTLDGSGPQPTFCNNQGLADAQLLGFGFRQFTGGVTLSLFADTRTGHSGEVLPLDLKSEGPSVTSIASSIAGAIPRDKETREVATPVTVSQSLRGPLQEMGVATKDLTVGDMIEFMVGRSMYRDMPLKARPTVTSGDYQVTVNRLSMASVEAAVSSYRSLVFTQALDANGVPQTGADGTAVMVNRTENIKDTIGNAWDAYSNQAQEADGVGFRAYLESKEASGTKDEKEALAYLRSAHEVLDRLDGLGLSPFEASIPKRKLLGEIRPPAMTLEQFQAAVAGSKLSMR
jgi:filamentous hemagglutinin family protein